MPNTRSHIYLKYRQLVQHLLVPDATSYRLYNYDDLYVKHDLYDTFIEYKKACGNDNYVYLTGLTGSGKTSLLKSVFKHYENTILLSDEELIIPYSFDNSVNNSEFHQKLSRLLFMACKKISSHFHIDNFTKQPDEFCMYIAERRESYGYNQRGWEECSSKTLLDQLHESHPLELSLIALKYMLKNPNCTIKNVIIIIDDIETIAEENELLPIFSCDKINSCLQNRSLIEKKKWCLNLIVACRHYVYRMKQTNETSHETHEKPPINEQNLEAFSHTNYDMNNIPSLYDILKKRKDTILATLSGQAKEDFLEIWKLLEIILRQAGNLILSLNLNNYRKSLETIAEVVFNKRWIQKNESIDGAFKVGTIDADYFTHLPALLRAIGLKEEEIYNENISLIPNLLYNDVNGDMDLWVLLILSYFLKNHTNSINDWKQSIHLQSVNKIFVELFTDNKTYINNVTQSICYLITKRLLLRSIDQMQQDSTDIIPSDFTNTEQYDKFTHVYISNAAKYLYETLPINSVLFEMYINDTYLNGKKHYPDEASNYLQFNIYNFRACIDYLSHFIDKEIELRKFIVNRGLTSEFVEAFGETPVTNLLYLGLKNSHKSYYKQITDYSKEIENSLNQLGDKLKKCYHILN